MPILRRPLGRALTAATLLAVGHAAAAQSQTTPRASPAPSGYRHPGWQATGFRGASMPHPTTVHNAMPTTGAPAPRESRDEPPRESRDEPPRESRGGSSQSIDPIPINTYHMGPRPQ